MKAARLKGWTDRRISLPRDVAPTKRLKQKNDPVLNLKCDVPCLYYFFLAVVVIRYETTATARWTLMFIVRAFINDTITVAVWTCFHVCASWRCYHTPAIIFAGVLLIRL
jgi:hypothetical protein